MSMFDRLLGRAATEAETAPEAAADDSWMTDEQRAARLAWWESALMDQVVRWTRLLLSAVAIAAALALLGLLGWALWSTPVPPVAGPITADMTRAASFGMIYIVLGVPVGLALLYFVGRFAFNVLVALCREPLHKVYRPLAAPLVALALLALLAWFHQPVHGAFQAVYFKVVQTHLLAKTSIFATQDAPLAPAP